jgi:hypothetical protein
MESKNFGAKRGNDYTVIEYFGMNCIQLSRKAPPGIEYPRFKTMGSQLLKSVEFRAYR